jgi:predicted nucleic acid-binding protein
VIVYLDSSVVLRVVVGQTPALAGWGNWDAAYSSEVLCVETRRTLDRLRLAGALDDGGIADAMAELGRIERTIAFVRLGRRILDRAAESMPTAVRTLDALHLASALAVRQRRADGLLFATHDARQALAARAFGFTCVGV